LGLINVLIIGNGGAGLSAALSAKNNGAKVLVLSKTYPTQSQTSQAQGGINGVLGIKDSKDSVESHINDTLKSAHNIGKEDAIKYMCENAKESIKWLDDIGVPFSRDEDNNIARRKLGGTKNPRACYSSDYTGLKILHTLYDNCIKNDIEFLNEHMLLDFIVEDKTIKGITCLDIITSEVKQILAKSVIIASGGYGAIYNGFTTNSNSSTGDSISLALDIGCELSDMEYIQFHPTSLKDSCILISESARGEGGYLVTKDEKRFVDELAPRDVVARAIYEKLLDKQEVFLDLRHLGLEKIKQTMPQEYNLALEFAKLKLDSDLIAIQPSAHYTMGGIKTDIDGKTNIKNLFAVGECSSNGVHGANRLGGNSLLEIITFGKRVGLKASESLKGISIEDKEYKELDLSIKNIQDIFDMPNLEDFYKYKKQLGEMFYKKVGLFRKEDELNSVLDILCNWQEKLPSMGINDKSKTYNTNLKEFLEFRHMLNLSKTIVLSALKRCESRGAHYRSDFPDTLDEFSKNIIITKKNNEILLELV